MGQSGLIDRRAGAAAGQRQGVHERKADLQFELQRLESGRGGDGRLAGRRPEGGFVAAASKLKIAVRGGGHSYIGASSANGAMVLDSAGPTGRGAFRQRHEKRTVSAATDLYAVHQALAGESRAIPTGSCPTVGVAGLTLGGGLGADSRHAGLTCDALKSATVVLPGGDAVSASADDHAELFWALRGGGGGNFGVTTSMTFARFPTADCDVVRVDFAPSAAAQVLVG